MSPVPSVLSFGIVMRGIGPMVKRLPRFGFVAKLVITNVSDPCAAVITALMVIVVVPESSRTESGAAVSVIACACASPAPSQHQTKRQQPRHVWPSAGLTTSCVSLLNLPRGSVPD